MSLNSSNDFHEEDGYYNNPDISSETKEYISTIASMYSIPEDDINYEFSLALVEYQKEWTKINCNIVIIDALFSIGELERQKRYIMRNNNPVTNIKLFYEKINNPNNLMSATKIAYQTAIK